MASLGFSGLTASELAAERSCLGSDAALPSLWWTTTVEDDDAVLERMRPFLEGLVARPDGDMLLVGHGGIGGRCDALFSLPVWRTGDRSFSQLKLCPNGV